MFVAPTITCSVETSTCATTIAAMGWLPRTQRGIQPGACKCEIWAALQSWRCVCAPILHTTQQTLDGFIPDTTNAPMRFSPCNILSTSLVALPSGLMSWSVVGNAGQQRPVPFVARLPKAVACRMASGPPRSTASTGWLGLLWTEHRAPAWRFIIPKCNGHGSLLPKIRGAMSRMDLVRAINKLSSGAALELIINAL
ncbi:unnamed protein product [Rhizoctonia solani]|uniref:Uncharacterized protein n=1 Tax=Rhizoctonia solani TaxID=456999 RepID=A0A8H2WQI9_9AGAM|nr:unnamed protein product [Rhizoctonia solani]